MMSIQIKVKTRFGPIAEMQLDHFRKCRKDVGNSGN